MMNAKDIIFDEEALQDLREGIKQVVDVVGYTLGPKGRNIGLEKSWGAPTITSDGGAIAKEIEVKDNRINMGVALAKELVKKVQEKTGDGITTSLVLLRALVEEGAKYIAAGASPSLLKRGMEKAVEAIIKDIESHAFKIKSDEEIRNIATVSASGNKEIGDTIAEAMKKVGKEGVITIEEAKGIETVIDTVEGMQLDRGYISAHFCTDFEKMKIELQNPKILIVEKKISNIHEILPLLQLIAGSGQQLLIIAEDIEGDALSTLVVNKLRGTLKIAAIKSPGFGDRRKALLQDIAVLTGGTLITEEAGIQLTDVTLDQLGSADQVMINKDTTVFVGGKGSSEQVKVRISQIEREIKETTSSYDIEKLEERKAKLGGGVAVIRVGAATEPELKQKKQMFEDSLSSTKAAVESGIVAGGGVALIRASKAIDNLNLQGDEQLGARAVLLACQSPLKLIASNAGYDGSVILMQVNCKNGNEGFNAMTGEIEDLVKQGIIDPAKVVVTALAHAASVAGIVLITRALIVDAEEEEQPKDQ